MLHYILGKTVTILAISTITTQTPVATMSPAQFQATPHHYALAEAAPAHTEAHIQYSAQTGHTLSTAPHQGEIKKGSTPKTKVAPKRKDGHRVPSSH